MCCVPRWCVCRQNCACHLWLDTAAPGVVLVLLLLPAVGVMLLLKVASSGTSAPQKSGKCCCIGGNSFFFVRTPRRLLAVDLFYQVPERPLSQIAQTEIRAPWMGPYRSRSLISFCRRAVLQDYEERYLVVENVPSTPWRFFL